MDAWLLHCNIISNCNIFLRLILLRGNSNYAIHVAETLLVLWIAFITARRGSAWIFSLYIKYKAKQSHPRKVKVSDV